MKVNFSWQLPSFHIELERWKWNDHYRIYVSTFGRFRLRNGEELKPKINNGGYFTLRGGLAHRIVLETWNGRDDQLELTVDHKDSNRRNNKLSNLEWVSQEENLRRARENEEKNVEKAAQKIINVFDTTKQVVCTGTLTEIADYVWKARGLDKVATAQKKVLSRRIANALEANRAYYDFTYQYVGV